MSSVGDAEHPHGEGTEQRSKSGSGRSRRSSSSSVVRGQQRPSATASHLDPTPLEPVFTGSALCTLSCVNRTCAADDKKFYAPGTVILMIVLCTQNVCLNRLMSEARVNFVVLRQSILQAMEVNEEGTSSGSSSNGESPVQARKRPSVHPCRRKSTQRDQPQASLLMEKIVTLKKEPRESLGITIGGGRDHKNKLPIYVSSVQPVGCLFRDGRIKKGDVLLSVNGVDLTCLSYLDAVSALKSNAASHTVVLKTLELVVTERHGDTTEGGVEVTRDPGGIWSPLWVHWFHLPSSLHWCRHISLRKSTFESWGFSIVGGYEETKGNQPFFIKTIVPATPAFFDGRLKCGDEIVEVNGVCAIGMSNAQLIPMLKEQKNRVTLTVVSWPGSLV
ncbi:unnamed protein product [Ranitomeya imitator]|uniref:PDZ domain-containing protein n=1 Tax=Ranitomeya imitator TaxID=111125 RepID=A0ABN9KVH1_9NEOB|nr:unnamed protein product [Ranitomeya imitator]